ncbi:MAG: ABC transporter permease [bacterium]
MSDLKLAFTYLRTHLLVTVLTVLSVALGLGLATIVLILSSQTKDTLKQETRYWDIVVGAKGSQLQLILNSMYYLDAPNGNISTDVWDHLRANEGIGKIVPVSVGDNYYGAPIIGTTTDFFTVRQQGATITSGRMFEKTMEVVVGAEVAERQHLTLGRQIVGSHGWARGGDEHSESPYTVVGILQRTGASMDRALYTDYRSVWEVHERHQHTGVVDPDEVDTGNNGPEITALLVQLKQEGRRYQLADDINKNENAMATIPVDQVDQLVKTFISPLQGLLLLVAWLVVIVAALSILISLYLSLHQRRRDLAVLRALGATQVDIFRMIIIEAAVLTALGVLGGWLLGHGTVALLSGYAMQKFGIAPHAWQVQTVELYIGGSVWLLGILAGILPAVVAYRLPVAETLIAE